MQLGRCLCVLCLLVTPACAHHRSAEGPLDRVERDPGQLVAEVARLRELPARRPVQLFFYEDAEFVARLPQPPRRPSATGLGFGVEAPPADVQREQAIAFYDREAHSIHVRRPASDSAQAEQATVLAVVHEIGHALQADNLPLPDLDRIVGDDARLAATALVEGDAMLTLLAYLAHRRSMPLSRAVAEVKRRIDGGDLDQAMQMSGSSAALMQTTALTRERMVFPYVYGLTFVGAVHAGGGFARVNRAFHVLPTTTEQILHPEKYFAGEGAARVPRPPPPGGYRVVEAGSLGELSLRALLGDCVDRALADRAAAGWGGDRYAWLAGPKQRSALLFSSVWDSPGDAREFEQVARSAAACWAAAGTGDHYVVRDGHRVVVLAGMGAGMRSRVAAQLLGAPI